MDAEAAANRYPGVGALREEIYWLSWPLVQWVLRWLAHFHFQLRHCSVVLAFIRLIFTRLGDTKMVEESHKIGKAMSKCHEGHRMLAPDAFYARLQRADTPLQSRGIPHIHSPEAHAYQRAQSRLPASGASKWSQVYGKAGLVKPGEQVARSKSKVLEGKYVSRTPATGRPSIAAAQALVELHGRGEFSKAKDVWQSICLIPHSLVRSESQAFLVLLQGTYAARAWPARIVPCKLGAPQQWAFSTTDAWVWLVVTDARAWRYIATNWVKNEHEPQLYGYFALQEIYPQKPHVPVMAEALVHRRAVTGPLRERVATLLPDSGQFDQERIRQRKSQVEKAREREVQIMEMWLDGHPLKETYMGRLQSYHRKQAEKTKKRAAAQKEDEDLDASESATSSSSASSVDPAGGALTFACLDNLDDDNRREHA